MENSRRLLRILAVVTVTVIALALRLRAVDRLPIDFDEDDYLAAAQRYATAMREGDLGRIVDYDFNYEHPPLTKLAYGLAILPLPAAPDIPERPSTDRPVRTLPQPHFLIARLTSAAYGVLEVLALALANPLAAFFLAIHTWQIKYTSQIMLEPLPSLTSALAVLFYLKWRAAGAPNRNGWLALSGVALGLTAASKYTYGIAGIAILIDWLWASYPRRAPPSAATLARWLAPVLVWGLIALAVFFIANPRLWAHPVDRLRESLLYHGSYAQSQHVKNAGYPMWQPFVWLFGPVPWHPGVFVLPLDLFISLMAVFGVRRLWRDESRRVFAIWLAIALGFLTWWTTKWPQYVLILTVPLTAAAAEGLAALIWLPLVAWWQCVRSNGLRPRRSPLAKDGGRGPDAWRALPWLLPGGVALGLIAFFPLIYQSAMALTDFSALSIRDGINGGVWREVAAGLTGGRATVAMDLFGDLRRATEVHYAGFGLLLQLALGLASDVLVFNVLWMVLSVALQTGLGLSAALLLNRPGVRFKPVWLSIFVLPWAIPEFVGALIWLRILYPNYGWLALAASPQGMSVPSITASPEAALGYLLLAGTWYGFPMLMLAATAGLKLIPVQTFDAAALDGAGGWALFRHVTWPLIWPLLAPALIIRAIFAFNQFYLFYAVNPPFPAITFSVVSFVYFKEWGQYAVSAAINVFTALVLVGLILWFNRWSRAGEGVTYA